MSKLFSTLTGVSLSFVLLSCSGPTESGTTNEVTEKEVPTEKTEEIVASTSEESAIVTEEGTELAQAVESKEIVEEKVEEVVSETHEHVSSTVTEKKEEHTAMVTDKQEVEETVVEEVVAKKEEIVKKVVKSKPDHSSFNTLLKKYVSSAGNVNYAGFKKEKAKLDAYTKELETYQPKSNWSKNEKLAYWINVYNAYTVQLILTKYPNLKSITELAGGKPWDKKFISLEGKTYSLNNIENDIIRPRFKEPRIHFAVNCASYSCPVLLAEAFTAAKLEKQLTAQTKRFVNDTNRNKLTAKKVTISKIFDWYGADFKSSGGAVKFISKYANTEIKEDASVEYMDYNWNLNK